MSYGTSIENDRQNHVYSFIGDIEEIAVTLLFTI